MSVKDLSLSEGLSPFRTRLMRIEFITRQRLVSINERKAPQAIFAASLPTRENDLSLVSVDSYNWRRKISNAPASESYFFFSLTLKKRLSPIEFFNSRASLSIKCHTFVMQMTHNHMYSWVILRVQIWESNGIPSIIINSATMFCINITTRSGGGDLDCIIYR